MSRLATEGQCVIAVELVYSLKLLNHVHSPALPSVPTGLVQLISNDDDSGQEKSLAELTPDLNSISGASFSEFSGVAFQIDWRDIEPDKFVNGQPIPTADSEGLERIQTVLDDAQSAGKWVQLLIIPGFFSPKWVLKPFSKPSDKFPIQYGQDSGDPGQTGPPMPLPIPWNAKYQDEWFELLKVISVEFGSNSAFRMIAAAGPTSVSDEMTEPDNQADNMKWKRDGYTPNLYVHAWQKTFHTYKVDFPNQYVSLSHGNDVCFHIRHRSTRPDSGSSMRRPQR